MPVRNAVRPVGLERFAQQKLSLGRNTFTVDTNNLLSSEKELYRVILCLRPTDGTDITRSTELSEEEQLALSNVELLLDPMGFVFETVNLKGSFAAYAWSRVPSETSNRVSQPLFATTRESISTEELTWDLVVPYAMCVLFESKNIPTPLPQLTPPMSQDQFFEIDVGGIAGMPQTVAWASRDKLNLGKVLSGSEWSVFVEFAVDSTGAGRLLSQNFASLVQPDRLRDCMPPSFPTNMQNCHTMSLYSIMIDIESIDASQHKFTGRRLRVRYRSDFGFAQKYPFRDDGDGIFFFCIILY